MHRKLFNTKTVFYASLLAIFTSIISITIIFNAENIYDLFLFNDASFYSLEVNLLKIVVLIISLIVISVLTLIL